MPALAVLAGGPSPGPRNRRLPLAVGEGPAAALPAIGILPALTLVLALISVRVFRWDEI